MRLASHIGVSVDGAAVAGRMQLARQADSSDIVRRPTDILDPVVLYSQNCAGCHGADGKLGPRSADRRSYVSSRGRR